MVKNTTVQLPWYPARPNYKEISHKTLAAIDPELIKTPVEYIHDGLVALGPKSVECLFYPSTCSKFLPFFRTYRILGGVMPAPLLSDPSRTRYCDQ